MFQTLPCVWAHALRKRQGTLRMLIPKRQGFCAPQWPFLRHKVYVCLSIACRWLKISSLCFLKGKCVSWCDFHCLGWLLQGRVVLALMHA